MADLHQSIEVDVSLETAYQQLAGFESLPKFLRDIREIRRTGENRLHWRAEVAGRKVEGDAEITGRTPNQRIAWRSLDGPQNQGAVTLEPLSDDRTRVSVELGYQPKSLLERLGDKLGIISWGVKRNLRQFKRFVESHSPALDA